MISTSTQRKRKNLFTPCFKITLTSLIPRPVTVACPLPLPPIPEDSLGLHQTYFPSLTPSLCVSHKYPEMHSLPGNLLTILTYELDRQSSLSFLLPITNSSVSFLALQQSTRACLPSLTPLPWKSTNMPGGCSFPLSYGP